MVGQQFMDLMGSSCVTLALHDLTGFKGRVDALYFTKGNKPPPNELAALGEYRRKLSIL